MKPEVMGIDVICIKILILNHILMFGFKGGFPSIQGKTHLKVFYRKIRLNSLKINLKYIIDL